MLLRCIAIVPRYWTFSFFHHRTFNVFWVLIKDFPECFEPFFWVLFEKALPVTFICLVPVAAFCRQPKIRQFPERLLNSFFLFIANHHNDIPWVLCQLFQVFNRLFLRLHMILAILLARQRFMVNDYQTPRRMQEVCIEVRQIQKLWQLSVRAFSHHLVSFHTVDCRKSQVDISCF